MARAVINNGRILFAALSGGRVFSVRGLSSSSRGMMEEKVMGMKGVKITGAATSDAAAAVANPWVPDPVTGNYRPANRRSEIDPAELRRMFLNKA